MVDISRDHIINVIYNQIKIGICVALEHNCYSSAIILIYSGIDTMAYLDMPEGQQDVTRDDFVRWADTYIHFPCDEQVKGLEFYGARCGMLHTFSSASGLSREGKVRQIGYTDKFVPEVCFRPEVSKDLVMISIDGFAKSFFTGVDSFLVRTFAGKKKARLAEQRLCTLVHLFPFDDTR